MNLKPGKVQARAAREIWKTSRISSSKRTNDGGSSTDDLAESFASLIGIIRQEIAEFERQLPSDGPSDGRIRSLATLVKTLQGLEEMQKRMEKATDDRGVDDEELLEIHRRIVGKIEKIIQRDKNH